MEFFGSFSAGLLGVLLFGCFVQVLVILSIVRFGLGLSGFDFGVVSFLLALVLSFVMIEAKFGISSPLEKTVSAQPIAFGEVLQSKIRPFLISATDPEIAQRISGITGSTNPSLSQLEAGFLFSQLKRALTVGLMLLLPLLIIDLLVAVSLTLVGIQSVSATFLAVPLKILLFVFIDGWSLILNKLLVGFV